METNAEIAPFRIDVPQADLDDLRDRLARTRLGYQRYGAQGGDWGAIISRELGLADPEHVAGVHLNMLITRPPEDLGELTEEEARRLQAARQFRATGSGYNMIQATRAWSPTARSDVPTGVAVFPREIAPAIRRFAERDNNIAHWSEFDRGGHFAAMEVPDLLTGDIREFFRPLR